MWLKGQKHCAQRGFHDVSVQKSGFAVFWILKIRRRFSEQRMCNKRETFSESWVSIGLHISIGSKIYPIMAHNCEIIGQLILIAKEFSTSLPTLHRINFVSFANRSNCIGLTSSDLKDSSVLIGRYIQTIVKTLGNSYRLTTSSQYLCQICIGSTS